MGKRKFTREFKASAVRLVNEQGYTIPDAARSLGIDPSNVRGWMKKFDSPPASAGTPEGDLRAEGQRLRKENARLLMEREILKKRRRSLPRSSREVRLGSGASPGRWHRGDVPGSGGEPQRLLRLAWPADQ